MNMFILGFCCGGIVGVLLMLYIVIGFAESNVNEDSKGY